MTDYYIGVDGDDGNNGLTWANRKATFNNVEALVGSGDNVYVGPGTYRQQHQVAVSGGAQIEFVGDVTGRRTDGIGGPVIITGSDDDETATRANCVIYGADANWRLWRGFTFQGATAGLFSTAIYDFDNLVLADCVFDGSPGIAHCVWFNSWDNDSQNFTIQNCFFKIGAGSIGIYMWNPVTARNLNTSLIQNCIFTGRGNTNSAAIEGYRSYNWKVRNCTFYNDMQIGGVGFTAVQHTASAASQPTYVYNSLFVRCGLSNSAGFPNELVEDYNVIMDYDGSDHTINITEGGNTVHRPANFAPPVLLDGFVFDPKNLFTQNEWSDIPSLACSSDSSSFDFYGVDRPATLSKRTRGAIQHHRVERDTTIVDSSDESIVLSDAMEHQIVVPVTGNQMKFSVSVYREANYAGTLPELVIKQPGQNDDETVDVGSAGQWNRLQTSLTPQDSPPYVAVCIRSNNTATSGNYKVYFDNFSVK